MAECACTSLIFTSFTYVPSLPFWFLEPRYLNWSTSSSVCSFIIHHTFRSLDGDNLSELNVALSVIRLLNRRPVISFTLICTDWLFVFCGIWQCLSFFLCVVTFRFILLSNKIVQVRVYSTYDMIIYYKEWFFNQMLHTATFCEVMLNVEEVGHCVK